MAGYWHLSSTMMFDEVGTPAPGAKAYFYSPEILEQLAVYKDPYLTTPWNQPVSADGFGRMPNVYLDDTAGGFYRFRVTDVAGVELIALATIPINTGTGGGGGGGGGTAGDPNALLRTGDTLWWPVPGATERDGFVRCNGRTIGSATSGALERPNSDCNALFLFLWNNLSNTACPVGGGRGANAAADWAANKTIGTIDMRGRTPFGLDDMGASAASRITTLTAIPNAITAGAVGGLEVLTFVKQADGGSQKWVSPYATVNTMPPFMLGTYYQRL